MAISVAISLGKLKTPVEMQGKAIVLNIGQPIGQGKTAAVARRQLVPLEITYALIADDGPDGMQNKSRRQVIGTGNFGIAGLFPVLLDLHDRMAILSKHGAGSAVNNIIDAVVQRLKAAQQLIIGGIDDCVDPQPCNIPFP